MNSFMAHSAGKVHLVHLGPNEDVLEGLKTFLRENNVQNGVILSGIGSLSRCSFHGVVTSAFPAKDEYYVYENAPTEVCGCSGIIADYEPHVHMALSVAKKPGEFLTAVGHLEPGCTVFCLAEFSILELEQVEMRRVPDKDHINQLCGRYLGAK